MGNLTKAVLIFSTLGFMSSAQAVTKPIGTFVPNLCGTPDTETLELNESLPGLLQVCLGELAYLDKEVVQLEFENDSLLVYEIKESSTTQKGRAQLRYFTAKNQPKLSKNLRMGQDKLVGELIESPQKKKNQHILEIRSEGLGLKAQVPLQIIFTTMGVTPDAQ